MSERTFLIQRYSTANWAEVRGQRPFLATGPSFKDYVVPGSLTKHGEYRFVSAISGALEQAAESPLWREAVAEWLLREGIVQALWSVDVDTCEPPERRWQLSVEAVAEEIPKSMPVLEGTVELLSGMGDPQYFRSYVSEDELSLEPCLVS